MALAFCGLMLWAWLHPQGRKIREDPSYDAAIGCCKQGCDVQYRFSLQGVSVLAPLCTSSETSLSFPGSFPKWVKKNLKYGFIKSCHLCPLQNPTWCLMLPEPSELPAGGCSCLGRAQALGKMELVLINKKNKKISNILLVTKSSCNADTWQRARFMTFCVEERFLIADGSLI